MRTQTPKSHEPCKGTDKATGPNTEFGLQFLEVQRVTCFLFPQLGLNHYLFAENDIGSGNPLKKRGHDAVSSIVTTTFLKRSTTIRSLV